LIVVKHFFDFSSDSSSKACKQLPADFYMSVNKKAFPDIGNAFSKY